MRGASVSPYAHFLSPHTTPCGARASTGGHTCTGRGRSIGSPFRNAVATCTVRGTQSWNAFAARVSRAVERETVEEVRSTIALSGSSKPRTHRRALSRGRRSGSGAPWIVSTQLVLRTRCPTSRTSRYACWASQPKSSAALASSNRVPSSAAGTSASAQLPPRH